MHAVIVPRCSCLTMYYVVIVKRINSFIHHLRLVGKRVGDFLLMLIELFSLGRTAEALRAIIGSKSAISL